MGEAPPPAVRRTFSHCNLGLLKAASKRNRLRLLLRSSSNFLGSVGCWVGSFSSPRCAVLAFSRRGSALCVPVPAFAGPWVRSRAAPRPLSPWPAPSLRWLFRPASVGQRSPADGLVAWAPRRPQVENFKPHRFVFSSSGNYSGVRVLALFATMQTQIFLSCLSVSFRAVRSARLSRLCPRVGPPLLQHSSRIPSGTAPRAGSYGQLSASAPSAFLGALPWPALSSVGLAGLLRGRPERGRTSHNRGSSLTRTCDVYCWVH